MLDPLRLPHRLTLVAGLSLLAALRVPSALAVEPMIEGGNERGFGLSATGDPPPVEAAAGALDWSSAAVLVLVAFVLLVSVLVVRDTSARRGRRLATR